MEQLVQDDLRTAIQDNMRLKSQVAASEAEVQRQKKLVEQFVDTDEKSQKAVEKVLPAD